MMHFLLDSGFELPQDIQNSPTDQAAIVLNSQYNQVPATALVDLWAHYLLVPNYLTASDEDRLRDPRNEFGLIEGSSEYFKNEGILIKNLQGMYEWIDDSKKLQDAWKNFSVDTYLRLKQGQ